MLKLENLISLPWIIDLQTEPFGHEWTWIKSTLQFVLIFRKEIIVMLSNLKKPEVTIKISEIGVRLRSTCVSFNLFHLFLTL